MLDSLILAAHSLIRRIGRARALRSYRAMMRRYPYTVLGVEDMIDGVTVTLRERTFDCRAVVYDWQMDHVVCAFTDAAFIYPPKPDNPMDVWHG